MELTTIYKLIRKYGNCACDLASVENPKHENYEFVKKYKIEKGNVIKKENNSERDIVILWADKNKMTNEVAKDVVAILKEHGKYVSLKKLIGEF